MRVVRLHRHVHAGVHRLGHGVGEIRGHVVGGLQRRHVAVVADHDAVEAEPLAQLGGQQEVRCGGRHSVDRGGVDHDGGRAGVDPRPVRRQEGVLQVADRELLLNAVVPVDRLRVAGEVLDRRGHLELAAARALHPADVRRADGTREHWLLGPGLVVAAPAVVARQVLHRREVPRAPVATSCCCVAAPASRASEVSQVAPIPIDCGKSVAWYG